MPKSDCIITQERFYSLQDHFCCPHNPEMGIKTNDRPDIPIQLGPPLETRIGTLELKYQVSLTFNVAHILCSASKCSCFTMATLLQHNGILSANNKNDLLPHKGSRSMWICWVFCFSAVIRIKNACDSKSIRRIERYSVLCGVYLHQYSLST